MAYFKRFKMEIDLWDVPPVRALPPGYSWTAWHDSLIPQHSDVLFASFHEEIDAILFPSLGSRAGCWSLMTATCRKAGFVPQATWLLACPGGYCGTVQGIRERSGLGAIQNLGVTPPHRGQGLGSALLLQALHGFGQAGLRRAFLEVTAHNNDAVRLYHRLGFRRRKTLYKSVQEPAFAI